MLHVLGFLVHLVPGHLERLGQEQLEQAVPADHLQRQPLAGLGQAGSFIGGIRRQARLGEGLEHAGDRARRDGERLRQLAGTHGAAGLAPGGDQRDRLDVVLDGQTGHDSKLRLRARTIPTRGSSHGPLIVRQSGPAGKGTPAAPGRYAGALALVGDEAAYRRLRNFRNRVSGVEAEASPIPSWPGPSSWPPAGPPSRRVSCRSSARMHPTITPGSTTPWRWTARFAEWIVAALYPQRRLALPGQGRRSGPTAAGSAR